MQYVRRRQLDERICQLQHQPTDHSRAKYGSPFLHAHHFCSYLRTELNHLPASRRRYPRHVSPEAVRYVELDYLCHNVSSSPSPLVKAERSMGAPFCMRITFPLPPDLRSHFTATS